MPVPAPEYELGQFFDLSPDLLCIAGFDGYFKRLNTSFERVLGYSSDELMSRPFLEFVHPDDVERARDAFIHLATGEDIIGFEGRLVCIDGSVRRFEWNTRTLPHLGALYGIARDVTDRSALAEEQAALRRVAVLVAQQPSPSEVFTAVTQAVGLLLDADLAALHVFPGDGTATTIASWSSDGPMLPIGTRFPLDGDSLAARIFETGAPARMHSDDEAWEREATDLARSLRVRSAVGAPILVEGKLWGALMAATRRAGPWAENAETRIAAFTELVATAIANAESREALAALADEQTALRHVATLVAQGASPQDLVEAVAEEVGRLLPVGSATMGRFEPDGGVTTVASWSTTEAAFPTGRRWPTEGTNVAWMVLQTGRSARIDDFSAATDPIGVAAREAGIKSAVGSPIVVEGHLWGVMTATSTEGPLPPDTEARLASFTELVATAVANAESAAEIAASRRRIVAASDHARRRIVRDLHDGAQQRLVHTVITLKLAQQALARGAEDGPLLVQEAVGHAERATHELRELAHGILPATLTAGGLRAGVEALASRMPVPVEVAIPADRLPAPIEATAYFVVAEALTNVAKHAGAASAAVAAQVQDGTLRVEVSDDGVGGARPDGSGLQGLADRLAALDGRLRDREHRRQRDGRRGDHPRLGKRQRAIAPSRARAHPEGAGASLILGEPSSQARSSLAMWTAADVSGAASVRPTIPNREPAPMVTTSTTRGLRLSVAPITNGWISCWSTLLASSETTAMTIAASVPTVPSAIRTAKAPATHAPTNGT